MYSEDVPVFKVTYGSSTSFAVNSEDVTVNTVNSSDSVPLAVFYEVGMFPKVAIETVRHWLYLQNT